MTRNLSLALGTVLVLAASAVDRSASAAAISIYGNFDTGTHAYSGDGVATTGGVWNQVLTDMASVGATYPPVTANQYYYGGLGYVTGSLVAADGSPTSVTFTDNYDSMAGGNTNPDISLFAAYLNNGTNGQSALLNVPAGTYNLYLYSQNGINVSQTTTFTVNGSMSTQTVTNDGADHAVFVNGVNYTEFTGISPDMSGTISINFAEGDANQAAFSGFQLVSAVSVPEPSSIVLLGIGLAAAALAARRRR